MVVGQEEIWRKTRGERRRAKRRPKGADGEKKNFRGVFLLKKGASPQFLHFTHDA